MDPLKMYFLLKMGMFHFYVNLQRVKEQGVLQWWIIADFVGHFCISANSQSITAWHNDRHGWAGKRCKKPNSCIFFNYSLWAMFVVHVVLYNVFESHPPFLTRCVIQGNLKLRLFLPGARFSDTRSVYRGRCCSGKCTGICKQAG